MNRTEHFGRSDLDIRVPLGPLLVNVLSLSYEAPVPGWAYGNHAHSSYELHFVSRGRGTLRLGTQHYDIVPGCFYLTGPGVYHEQKADRDDPMDEYCLNFEYRMEARSRQKSPAYLAGEIEEIARTLAQASFWFGDNPFPSPALFEQLFLELEQQWLGNYSAIQNLVALIVLHALRCVNGLVRSSQALPRRQIPDARRLLMDGYFQQVSLPRTRQELAERIGTSVRHMNRIVHAAYGLSFRDKLEQSRLDQARDLLLSTNRPIQDWVAQVGYQSATALAAAFRRRFGVSPHAYRTRGKR